MSQLIDPSSSGAVVVTKSDTIDIVYPSGIKRSKGIYVGVTGDLNLVLASGVTVLFKAVAAGVVHPISVKRVMSASTTATDIVALY
ncbi:hypothetical protein A8709_33010 [Paenibacillus pectinilyticus]|uniref:Uncharacterized protein n=1 Tax=Paenibacillus pectinilyticus TaxID=512399 RepID=A0A1C0ZWZ5_9BACL|nr:hypothetical protein [Paenibacillus pectinilyticus]OCT12632.1 hypothetical protein A8709_33010 [Paenibacillus pectinilyticus]